LLGYRGHTGDEIEDLTVNMSNIRRRSNSSSHAPGAKAFKTKFEVVEPEPVFEDMPYEDDALTNPEHVALEKQTTDSTTSSSEGHSIDEEH
jgi:hypothetical protein